MTPYFRNNIFLCCNILFGLFLTEGLQAQVEGYYRFPDLHDNRIVFAAEGDLWTIPLSGGEATRLTTHPELELFPKISPDGRMIAFSASYEGPTEIYTMPINGGLPNRWTHERDFSTATCWAPDGKLVYDTRAFSTLPDRQLVAIDMNTKSKNRIPLSQASEASYSGNGKTIYFVRPGYHGNVTKRYKGGTARQIWKFTFGSEEAIKVTKDYAGESHHPMWYNDRIYFITDRDGIMNIWSMTANGSDLTQHTRHANFDVRTASISKGNIVYHHGADLWHYNITSNETKKIAIKLVSDLDQLREKWIDNPSSYITSVRPDYNGERIVITARGRVFVAPVKNGRFVNFDDKDDVRYRDAFFSRDGKEVITLSDESGEFEFIRFPANGIGSQKSITSNGKVLRFEGIPSPDGKWIAYNDLHNNGFILNLLSGVSTQVSTTEEGIYQFSWSPDSRWLAFIQSADNTMSQIFLYNLAQKNSFPITTDRANSLSPQWSPDGKFIYFLSDRSFTTLVGAPWGPRQPEPYFDASEKIYHIALNSQTRSPFRVQDELFTKEEKEENDDQVVVTVDQKGIVERIEEVPIAPGNYNRLAINEEAIYLMARETGVDAQSHLKVIKIDHEKPKLLTMIENVRSFVLTDNGKKLMVRKADNFFMIPAGTDKVSNLNDNKIDLSGWKLAITPQKDFRQLFTDAWRMERDYFYDKNMHGVNWNAMHDKYYPLVDRVTTRDELSDLIGRFVGELSALHTSVRGGDHRSDDTNIEVASLGALFSKHPKGFKIEYIFKADPDYPDEKSPLDDPYLNINAGDIITAVNGHSASSAIDIGELIRDQVGKQVRISLDQDKSSRDVIVTPIGNTYNLRYRDWEYSRRLKVEEATDDKVGYVHLRAMGRNDLNQWYREFYPVFDRPGLIIDVRHNRGGNIESFILEKLLRKSWMYWQGRTGKPYWNMQYAFRGHIVVLVDENTASDGEAFADGFKRLNLGTAIGTRTWGGEIWLGSANRLSDGGLARAPMSGVYGPEGKWLIEGHGFEPDIIVQNPPHATYNGSDAQLEAAIELLEKLIKEDPRSVPKPPPFPDKTFNNK